MRSLQCAGSEGKNGKIAHKFPVFRSEVGEGFSAAMGPGRAGGRELWGRRRWGFLELWALGPPTALLLGPSYEGPPTRALLLGPSY